MPHIMGHSFYFAFSQSFIRWQSQERDGSDVFPHAVEDTDDNDDDAEDDDDEHGDVNKGFEESAP